MRTKENAYETNQDGSISIHCIQNRTFVIDHEDLPLVRKYKWHITDRGYVVSGSVKPMIRLHRLLMGLDIRDSHLFVDHISGNTLDNRRMNLRVCKPHENNRNQTIGSRNTSGFKGVSYWKSKGKYIAEIVYHDVHHKRRREFLGYFDSAYEAALVYDQAAVLYHGEFAKTNAQQGLLEVENEYCETV
jgi:hypothetical protein